MGNSPTLFQPDFQLFGVVAKLISLLGASAAKLRHNGRTIRSNRYINCLDNRQPPPNSNRKHDDTTCVLAFRSTSCLFGLWSAIENFGSAPRANKIVAVRVFAPLLHEVHDGESFVQPLPQHVVHFDDLHQLHGDVVFVAAREPHPTTKKDAEHTYAHFKAVSLFDSSNRACEHIQETSCIKSAAKPPPL